MSAKPSASPPIFYPKLLTTIGSTSREQLWRDGASGVIVGIVALPLAIAFAIASGVSPDKGLATAIIAGFLISALGGSRVQIGGPTGAFVVIVYGIVERHGVEGLTVCTLMAGAILVVMGLCGLGTFMKFIPYPLTVGFTSGIAVIIFSQQIRDLLGLKTETMPADFVAKWEVYFKSLHTADPLTMALSAAALAILMLWPRVSRKVPGPFVALAGLTAAAVFWNLPVETIGSRFGDLHMGLPKPAWPSVSWREFRHLVGPAITVAMLGAIESLLSATVGDAMIEGRHRSNTELIAQGVANMVAPLFGGIPATGAIARTATNVKNGGRTPVAGMVHALTLLVIALFFGAWVRHIPMCVLAGILVVVSYHMSEWRSVRALIQGPKMDVAVLATTFFLTVFVDLTVAVEAGMVMSAVLFMKRMTDVTTIREVTRELSEAAQGESKDLQEARDRLRVPEGVLVYEAEGAFFFGVTESLRDTLSIGATAPRAIILRMRHVVALDASALRALLDLSRACRRAGTRLILAGLSAQPRKVVEQSSYLAEFGARNICRNVAEAVATLSPGDPESA